MPEVVPILLTTTLPTLVDEPVMATEVTVAAPPFLKAKLQPEVFTSNVGLVTILEPGGGSTGVTVNNWVTLLAGLVVASPACEAVIVEVPADII